MNIPIIDKLIVTPFDKFFKIQSSSGIILLVATVAALVWANTPMSEYYHALWEYKVGFESETLHLYKPLLLWINDGLMAIFFFVIGLEIKRELLMGELNSPRKAALPLVAAIGGMVVPIGIFLFMNNGEKPVDGWGIPMATDIAFALAILKLLGDRIPVTLKVFLTAFAIVDDLGAVTVIALYYSSDLHVNLLLYSLIPFALLTYLALRGVYQKYVVVVSGIVVWVLFLKAGIHPTIAGVLLAFTIPISQRIDVSTYRNKLKDIVKRIQATSGTNLPLLTQPQIDAIDDLEDWTDKVQSPVQHLEHRLHNWVAYFIIPIFAFANAGVTIDADMNLNTGLTTSIIVSLILGKSLGVSLFTIAGSYLGIVDIPSGVRRIHILGLGFIAGVGFTMSIFIGNLAYEANPLFIDSAKLGILVGSFLAGLAGYLILRFGPRYVYLGGRD